MKRIKIFDTTLRDGEQSPGCSMNIEEKVEVAKQLEKLGVDVIEAGFAIASEGDFKAVQAIARVIENCTVASLARATKVDIDRAYEAVKDAKHPRIHTFIATSDLHLEYKLKKTKDEIIAITREMVSYAKSLCDDVEFSCEDATRSNHFFMIQVIEAAIESGAKTINIPDTVGYTSPQEYHDLIKHIREHTKGIDDVSISVHCHNDLGMAVANSIAAIEAGADQVECTVNGIGERAGNAALEEIVMAIKTRSDIFKYQTNIHTEEIVKTSELVSYITGVKVQPNKAIVGANAFAHESGIHQHGVINNRMTYEIMTPESVGLRENSLILGKHSGKHAFRDKLDKLGYELSDAELNRAFIEFKDLLDKKKEVYDTDIVAIVRNETIPYDEIIKLHAFNIHSSTETATSASVKLQIEDGLYESVEMGDGPVDAAFKAIQRTIGVSIPLRKYQINAVTEGKDAQGETVVKTEYDGLEYTGHGLSTDIIESSIEAYISVINKIMKDSVIYNEMKERLEQERVIKGVS